jgi:hypothetical protein
MESKESGLEEECSWRGAKDTKNCKIMIYSTYRSKCTVQEKTSILLILVGTYLPSNNPILLSTD